MAVRSIVRSDIEVEAEWRAARKQRVADALAALGGSVDEAVWAEVYDEAAGMYWRAGDTDAAFTWPEFKALRPKEGAS